MEKVDPDIALHERPTTRQELNALRQKFSNNQTLAYHYYQDPMLQMELKILFLGAYYLMKEYQTTIEEQKAGKDSDSALFPNRYYQAQVYITSFEPMSTLRKLPGLDSSTP